MEVRFTRARPPGAHRRDPRAHRAEIWFPYGEREGHQLLCREIWCRPCHRHRVRPHGLPRLDRGRGRASKPSGARSRTEESACERVRSGKLRRRAAPEPVPARRICRACAVCSSPAPRGWGSPSHHARAPRAARGDFPRQGSTCLVSRGMGALLEENPDVDHVIEIDGPRWSRSSAIHEAPRGRYDLVLDMVSNPGAPSWRR